MNKKERLEEKPHYTGTAPSGFPPGICWLPRRRGRGEMCTEEASCSESRQTQAASVTKYALEDCHFHSEAFKYPIHF